MTLNSHLDGGVLTICSVGDQNLQEGLQQLEVGLDLARNHHATRGARCDMLIDLRESEENKDPDELRDMAAYLAANLAVLTGRIAVVVERGLRFGLARMFAVYGEKVGLVTMVSTDEAAARAWLRRGESAVESEEA